MHDFGIIRESDGKASTVFTFANKGDKPLLINNVKASCGCTTPSWTKTPIEPGQTGKVVAAYNPKGHSGSFEKTLTIKATGIPDAVTVTIKGTVYIFR